MKNIETYVVTFIVFISVERYYNGTLRNAPHCLNCTDGTVPSSDRTFCMPCLLHSHNCSCPAATHELLDGICVPLNGLSNWPDDRNSYVIEFGSGEKIDSYFLREHLRSSVYLCKVCAWSYNSFINWCKVHTAVPGYSKISNKARIMIKPFAQFLLERPDLSSHFDTVSILAMVNAQKEGFY
jgi:hypothetical protein